MNVLTYIGWIPFRTFLKKKGLFFRSIVEMWSYTLCDGDCIFYCQHKLHLRTKEERKIINQELIDIYIQ